MSGSVGVVWNPVGGRGVAARRWPAVEAEFQRLLGSRLVAVEATTGSGSARSQAEAMAGLGLETIVAAGGDGTIGDVMQGVLGKGVTLAVVPFGTGNDTSRMLGFGTDWKAAVAAIAAGNTATIDVAHWRQGEREGHYINAAGCGFDAAVAERINHGYRWLRGTGAYIGAVIQTLATYKATDLAIEVDGDLLGGRAMLCALANARSYGGGMNIAPTADLSDGFLDLVFVGEVGKADFLKTFPKVFKGTHLSHPQVEHRRFQRLTIVSHPPAPFLVDGELLAPGPVTVNVVPGALKVVVP